MNPTIVFGAGDVHVTSTRLVRSFLLGRVPIYTDGAVNVVDVRDVAEGHLLADRLGAVGRALHPRRAQLHLRPAVRGPRPPLRRRAAGQARGHARARGSPACSPPPAARGPLAANEVRAASQWWTYRATKARRELGWRARPHEETLEATVAWHLEREHDRIARSRRSQQLQYRVAGAAVGAAEEAVGLLRRVGGFRPVRRTTLTAWRRSTAARRAPTASAAAARWRAGCARSGIEYEEIRVPLRRRDRPEVEELTDQRWVPVLVLDDEVVHDSHRILEYLDWLEQEQAA